jgi:hypothetical protein
MQYITFLCQSQGNVFALRLYFPSNERVHECIDRTSFKFDAKIAIP